MSHNRFDTYKEFKLGNGTSGRYYSLAALEAAGWDGLLVVDS